MERSGGRDMDRDECTVLETPVNRGPSSAHSLQKVETAEPLGQRFRMTVNSR